MGNLASFRRAHLPWKRMDVRTSKFFIQAGVTSDVLKLRGHRHLRYELLQVFKECAMPTKEHLLVHFIRVSFQHGYTRGCVVTLAALVRLLTGMFPHVNHHMAPVTSHVRAHGTFESLPITSMRSHVAATVATLSEPSWAQ